LVLGLANWKQYGESVSTTSMRIRPEGMEKQQDRCKLGV